MLLAQPCSLCGCCQICGTGLGSNPKPLKFKGRWFSLPNSATVSPHSHYFTSECLACLLPPPHSTLVSSGGPCFTITWRKHQAMALPWIHSDSGSHIARKATSPLLVPVALMSLPPKYQLPPLLLTHSCPTGCLAV